MALAQRLKAIAPTWAKEASRPGFRVVGRATYRQRPLPDFLIIGTKRGGTTSMFKYLLRHPCVLPMWPGVENAKKTHFFDRNWHRGKAWYRAHFPTVWQRQRVERVTGAAALSGEAAPYYMFHPLVFERVRALIPAVKVIVLLRNPVDRVWSHHHERVNAGTEPLSFAAALEAEEQRLSGEAERIVAEPGYYSQAHDFGSYLARGRYFEQLAPWLAEFYPHQLHIVRSEDLYTNPAETVVAVQRFLGLPAVPPPTPHRFNYVAAKRMDDETRARLADYYRDGVAALEERIGRSFDWQL